MTNKKTVKDLKIGDTVWIPKTDNMGQDTVTALGGRTVIGLASTSIPSDIRWEEIKDRASFKAAYDYPVFVNRPAAMLKRRKMILEGMVSGQKKIDQGLKLIKGYEEALTNLDQELFNLVPEEGEKPTEL